MNPMQSTLPLPATVRDDTRVSELPFDGAGVLDRLAEAVSIIGANGRFLHANAAARAVLSGISERRGTDTNGMALAHEQLPAERTRLTGEEVSDADIGFPGVGGEVRWLRISTRRVSDDGPPYAVVVSYSDVTAARQMAADLARVTQMFSAAFADAPIGMALVGLDGSFLKVNRRLCALIGYSEQELLSRTFQEITHPEDLAADLGHIQELLGGEISFYSMEKRYFTADGRLIWVNLHTSLVRSPEGTPEHFIAQIEDITERRRMLEELRRLAEQDPLTGVWNRRRFEEELERQIARCRRYGEQAALLVLDLDDFKQVNDTVGHRAGDDLLRAVTHAMRGRLRSTDALARLGGDEFAVLLANIAPERVDKLADEIAHAVRTRAVVVRDREISATISIGVALLDGGVDDAEAALVAADNAMYEAKARGRGRTSMQSPQAPAAAEESSVALGQAIRVVHCDDSGPYRRLVELMLEEFADIELVGSVSDHQLAVEECRRLEPDVVLLDALMPHAISDPVGAIKAVAPNAAVLMLSGLDDPDHPLRSAVDGFMLKTWSFDEVAGAIRASARPALSGGASYGRGAGADSAIDTVRRIYAAFARQDLSAALEHAAEDMELVPSGTSAMLGRTEPYRGHEGVRQYFADAAALWEELEISAQDFRATAGGVIVFGKVEGIVDRERISRQVVWVWQVTDGKATSMRVSDVGAPTAAG
jgi:diguanylate cyclase (GGDEF)-like protein/PAS domain S-box-containing protein